MLFATTFPFAYKDDYLPTLSLHRTITMSHQDAPPLSDPRAMCAAFTPNSPASRQGSIMSLINAEERFPENLPVLAPAFLIERFGAWGIHVKKLGEYFEGVAKVHKQTADQFNKLAKDLPFPGNQFLGGLQQVIYNGIRDETRVIADQHTKLGERITNSIVTDLKKLTTGIGEHRKKIINGSAKLAAQVAKERRASDSLVAELSSCISSFDEKLAITSKTDPYVTRRAVFHQFAQQEQQERRLIKSFIETQNCSKSFDETIVGAIKSAWQRYEDWQTDMSAFVAFGHSKLVNDVGALAPGCEWVAFAGTSGYIVNPNTPPPTIKFTQSHRSIRAVCSGPLNRIRVIKDSEEWYFVLTRAKFLHQYKSSDPTSPEGDKPVFSLYVPKCKLSAPSSKTATVHAFSIAGRTENSGTTKTILNTDHAQLSAQDRKVMMGWWNSMTQMCKEYSTTDKPTD
ncbi:hypothetical protein DFH06DRAFT_1421680, partial [Mycena polygramma]